MDPSSPSLPVEVLHVILNEVDSSNDQQTLKVCSLVSRLFLMLCRKHLFSSVTILVAPDADNADDEDQQNESAVQFLSFLVTDDHASSFIQNLCIRNDTGVPMSSTWTTVARSLDRLLPKLSLLTSLSIHGNLIADWTSSDITLRVGLMRLCRRPTLKALNLNFVGISQQELLSLIGIANLSLSSVHLNPDTLDPVSELQEDLSSPNIISRLSTLSVVVGDLYVSQAMWSLAKASASTLKSLKWMSSPYYRELFTYQITALLRNESRTPRSFSPSDRPTNASQTYLPRNLCPVESRIVLERPRRSIRRNQCRTLQCSRDSRN